MSSANPTEPADSQAESDLPTPRAIASAWFLDKLKTWLGFASFLQQRRQLLRNPALYHQPPSDKNWQGPWGFALSGTLFTMSILGVVIWFGNLIPKHDFNTDAVAQQYREAIREDAAAISFWQSLNAPMTLTLANGQIVSRLERLNSYQKRLTSDQQRLNEHTAYNTLEKTPPWVLISYLSGGPIALYIPAFLLPKLLLLFDRCRIGQRDHIRRLFLYCYGVTTFWPLVWCSSTFAVGTLFIFRGMMKPGTWWLADGAPSWEHGAWGVFFALAVATFLWACVAAIRFYSQFARLIEYKAFAAPLRVGLAHNVSYAIAFVLVIVTILCGLGFGLVARYGSDHLQDYLHRMLPT
jgi:hypothetical protein